jgi:hypothetical protein
MKHILDMAAGDGKLIRLLHDYQKDGYERYDLQQ